MPLSMIFRLKSADFWKSFIDDEYFEASIDPEIELPLNGETVLIKSIINKKR